MKTLAIFPILLLGTPLLAQATTPRALIDGYTAQSGIAPSADRGQAMFLSRQSGGKPDTPSCTTCHTQDPRKPGQARTGKPIDPLAPSVNALRFTDTKFVEKWFGRNCNSVLGRACTAAEKADFITWLESL